MQCGWFCPSRMAMHPAVLNSIIMISLNGVSGREYGYLNGDSNVERTVKPAQNGRTLELTIDVNIQKIVQKYLDEWQAGIGSNLAAAIVMDPNSGGSWRWIRRPVTI